MTGLHAGIKPRFHVILRACDAVAAFNGAPRPFGLDKRTLVMVCFRSLHESLRAVDHRITVLGDQLSPELAAFFEGYGVTLRQGRFGNEGSIRETFKIAESVPDDEWIYFCEDDYLHVPHAMRAIEDFIVHGHRSMQRKPRLHSLASLLKPAEADLVVFPPDYPDRYLGKYRRFSLVFHGTLGHWRQVSDTTFTFLMQGRTFRRHRRLLDAAAQGANDRLLSRRLYGRHHFLGRALCVSPMPGLSSHMHTGTMSPLVDWGALVERQLEGLGLGVLGSGLAFGVLGSGLAFCPPHGGAKGKT